MKAPPCGRVRDATYLIATLPLNIALKTLATPQLLFIMRPMLLNHSLSEITTLVLPVAIKAPLAFLTAVPQMVSA